MVFLFLLLAAQVPVSLCEEVRDILIEGGMTKKEVRRIVRRCERINNPELKNQNDA